MSTPATPPIEVRLFSFGFKYGEPARAEMVFDVRFLPNPYWQEGMRERTGLEHDVAAYVLESDSGRVFIEHLVPLLRLVVGEYGRTGRKLLRIAIGCTGGQHRSVAVVERLAKALAGSPVRLQVAHRDIDRE